MARPPAPVGNPRSGRAERYGALLPRMRSGRTHHPAVRRPGEHRRTVRRLESDGTRRARLLRVIEMALDGAPGATWKPDTFEYRIGPLAPHATIS